MNAEMKQEWPEDGGFAEPAPTSKLAAALAKAQGEFAPVLRDKTVTVTMKSGGKYTFSYAPLESILHAVAPALSKNELALTQAMEVVGGKDYVETMLRHSSGQTICNRIPLFVRDDGPQAYGSALTYARRYGVTLLLCISADDDDDGNAAEGNQAETTKQRGPSQEATRALAQRFREAAETGIDGRMLEVHDSANPDQELYKTAWALLSAPTRSALKGGIERARAAKAKDAK